MIERFWAKVEITDGCWLWLGAKQPSGYGNFWTGRRFETAHRISYELASRTPIGVGLYVCHHCDNPQCTRPDHLFLGTAKDNNADAAAKGHTYRHPQREYCKYGHRLEGDNLYFYPSGKRSCRTCRRNACIRYFERQALGAM